MMLDFNNENQLINFLKRDKHKLLEGLVVEDFFMKDVINTQKWNPWISTGWWATKVNDPKGDSDYILFHVTSIFPSANDIDIYKTLMSKQVVVYHVLLSKNNLYFLELNELVLQQPLNFHNYIHEYVFLSKNQLIKKNSVHKAKDETRDSFLQDRAITYFRKYNIIKEIALQRYFANYFLTVHFSGSIINIDSFMAFSDGLAAFEIKFKYPDSKGAYGINTGPANLFHWLLKKDIFIHHYIAKNPSCKKNIGIFEVITSQSLKSSFYWEKVILNKEELIGSDSIAPEETSIAGDHTVNFKSISANKFMLTNFPVANCLNSLWIPLKKCPQCGHEQVVINGKYSYFLGCSTYKACSKS
ncbi:hypothetical protein [Rossellomorea aquimaris]|uniref:hypothetical protein n=1 Tax=Rossellomorea aquimaris TaxID=189382 RepID=UPI0005C9C6AF|nr:hypothetical protein [Rossellomorea aquimaris]